MKDKERTDYRNMLRLAYEEFESLYRQHQFSDVTAKKLFYRICRVLAKYNKNINQQEDLLYWSRKDVKDVLEPIKSSELDMALSKNTDLENTIAFMETEKVILAKLSVGNQFSNPLIAAEAVRLRDSLL